MQKTKIIIALIATSLVIVALAGVTYALVNAQTPNSTYYSQTPSQPYNGNYGYLPPMHNDDNGYYSYPQGPNPYPYGFGMGMGPGRCW